MRQRDIEEIRAGWGLDPILAMRNCLSASSYARTAFVGLAPLCMYGIAPMSMMGQSARLWMFGTDLIDRHPMAFARASRREIPKLMRFASLLTNLVDVHDTAAMRWLEWLGATYVLKPNELGGKLFVQFIINTPKKETRHVCQQV